MLEISSLQGGTCAILLKNVQWHLEGWTEINANGFVLFKEGEVGFILTDADGQCKMADQRYSYSRIH